MVADKFPNGLNGLIGLNPNGLIGPIGPIVPRIPPQSARNICCQKGLDLAYRKSEHPRIVQEVQPRVLSFWDRSKMTPYHNKLPVEGLCLQRYTLAVGGDKNNSRLLACDMSNNVHKAEAHHGLLLVEWHGEE